LPQPQQIHYGSGALAVRGLEISLPSDAAAEDRFAAEELSSSLSRIVGSPIFVSEGGSKGKAITLRRSGALDPLPTPGEKAGPDSRESYSIKVTREGVEVEGRSSAAVYYGVQTLIQLVEGTGAEARLPEVEIHDWPSLPYRGVMVDTSHGGLPTEAEVKRQIDFLARWKNNQYYLYSEASIELEGFPILTPEAQFNPDEIRRIVTYGRERHIDVVPCVELYGHLHDLFRVERYADLAILPHGSEFDPRNPQVAALMKSWVEQLTSLFPSRFFHIGFDETREARVAVAPDKDLPATLYEQQFRLVSGLVREHGRTLLVWSDMFAQYPNLIPLIPEGINALRIHVHVENSEFYDVCGRLGIVLIQDSDLNWMFPTDEQFTRRAVAVVGGMVKKLRNHPSIICWICINEAQRRNEALTSPGPQVVAEVHRLDPTRPTIRNSDYKDDLESGDAHDYRGSLGQGHYTDIFGSTEKLATEFGVDAPPGYSPGAGRPARSRSSFSSPSSSRAR
jgi:hypothetical protein